MKLATIKNLITSRIGRQILTVQKHSPAILFGAGVVGIVTTVVLASRATLKLEEVLDDAHHDLITVRALENVKYTEEDRKRDTVLIYARTVGKVIRLYGPTVVIGSLSITALTGSHVILTKRNLAVTAAYAALDQGFRQYRERVIDEFGIDKDREFRYAMEDRTFVEETEEGPVTMTLKQIGANGASVYARFFDESSVNWSKRPSYNQLFLTCQQNYANDLLKSRGHVFLNEVYDMLGLPRSKEGAVVGWVLGNGDNHVDFGVFEGDRYSGMRFVLGHESSVLLDFNVDGIIYDKI